MSESNTKIFGLVCGMVAVSCAGPLSRAVIKNHPRIKVTVFEPQVVESSAPVPPAWTRQVDRGAPSYVAFSGQAFAPTLAGAKKQAMDDLVSAVSSYVSVDVDSRFEARETYEQRGKESSSSTDISSVVRSRTQAKIEGLKADSVYWEKVVASPLTQDNPSFRYWVYARVPKVEITRARLKSQLQRQKKSGKKMIAVLPFRSAMGAASQRMQVLSFAFAEELSRRLAGQPQLYVGDPSLVRSLIAGEKGESEAQSLEAVGSALLPDFIISGGYQLHQARLRVTYSIYQGSTAKVLHTESVEGPYAQLFELQERLIKKIGEILGQPPGAKAPATIQQKTASTKLESFELYHGALADFQAGKNEDALRKLKKAISRSPSYARAFLRMGRVLERMGRYGRIPGAKAQGQRSSALEAFRPCIPWSKVSQTPYRIFTEASSGDPVAVEGLMAQQRWAHVDHVLSAAEFLLVGRPLLPEKMLPRPTMPREVSSAIEAYWRALVLAHGQLRDAEFGEDRAAARRLVNEIALTLADLAARIDRAEQADRLYGWLVENAQDDLHILSLAILGRGKLEKGKGQFTKAIPLMQRALELRAQLLDKPFLLEVYNELAGLAVSVGRYRWAQALYKTAWRMADDLENDYLRAVLSNNIGVLEYLTGNTAQAQRRFDEAFERLQDLNEAQGQISAGLNVGLLGYARGDMDRARAYINEVRRIVLKTRQESKMAQLYEAQAKGDKASGAQLEAMRALLRAWAIQQRLGRTAAALRLRNNLAVSETYALLEEALTPALITCLQDRQHRLLALGYGADQSTLLANGYSGRAQRRARRRARRRWRRRRWTAPPRWRMERAVRRRPDQFMDFDHLRKETPSYLYGLLNAEVLANMRAQP